MGKISTAKGFSAVILPPPPYNDAIPPPDPVRAAAHTDRIKDRRDRELVRKNDVLDARREQRDLDDARATQRALQSELDAIEQAEAQGGVKGVNGVSREDVKSTAREIKEERKKLGMLEEIASGVADERSQLELEWNVASQELDRHSATSPSTTAAQNTPAFKKAHDELCEVAYKLDRASARRSEREKEFSSIEQSIEKATTREIALGEENEQLEKETETAREEKEQADVEYASHLTESPFETAEEELEHERVKVVETHRKVNKLKPIQGELLSIQKRITQYRQELEKVPKTIDRLSLEVEKLKEEAIDRAKTLHDLRHEAKAKSCEVAEVQEGEYKLAEKQNCHANLFEKRIKLERGIAFHSQAKQSARQQLSDAAHAKSSIEARSKAAHAKAIALRAEVKAIKVKVKHDPELDARLNKMKASQADWVQRIETYQTRVDEVTALHATLESEGRELEHRVAQKNNTHLPRKLEEVNINILKLKTQLSEARRQAATDAFNAGGVLAKMEAARRETEVELKRGEMLQGELMRKWMDSPGKVAREVSEAKEERTRWKEQHASLIARINELKPAPATPRRLNSAANVFRPRVNGASGSGAPSAAIATSSSSDPRGKVVLERLANVIKQLNKAVDTLNDQVNTLRSDNTELVLQIAGC